MFEAGSTLTTRQEPKTFFVHLGVCCCYLLPRRMFRVAVVIPVVNGTAKTIQRDNYGDALGASGEGGSAVGGGG